MITEKTEDKPMKRILMTVLVILALLLAGCSSAGKEPDPHPDWNPDWARVHPHLGVEDPEGFTLSETYDGLRSNGMCFAAWTAGEEKPYTDAQGKESKVYDAQIYVLVKICESDAEAQADLESWIGTEGSAYEARPEEALSAAGQTYRLLILDGPKDNKPYHHGAAAFTTCGTAAVSVELLCSEHWPGNAEETLSRFLEGFHYGFPEE